MVGSEESPKFKEKKLVPIDDFVNDVKEQPADTGSSSQTSV